MTKAIEQVVIAGASAAGLSVADGLREGGYQGKITVLSAELHLPYDRPTVSKELLVSESVPTLLALRTAERLSEQDIDLRLGQEAVGLDIDRHYVITSDGEPVPWDAVVIATGSRPRKLFTDSGVALPVLRTPDDLTRLRAGVEKYREVTLIGSGFIGLEVAAGLIRKGVKVTVFDGAALPLESVIGTEMATHVRDLHLREGVDLHCGMLVHLIEGGEGDYRITFTDGTVHRTPFILAGIGVEANTDWLEGSGVNLNRGVVTDSEGRSNVPGVWAAGDVAMFAHPLLSESVRVEHWTHAIEQGRIVGLNIARSTPVAYSMPPYFWSDQFDQRFHSYGRRRPGDELRVVHGSLDDGEFIVLFGDGMAFHAVFSSGGERLLRPYRRLLERRATWAEALDHAQATAAV